MNTEVNTVIAHLFRQESGKLAATLARVFRLSRLEEVEDIVQDTMFAALAAWSFRGVPAYPTAWLHQVGRNKAVDYIRKRRHRDEEPLELHPGLRDQVAELELERNFLSWEIADSQLRMMFACCHPGIPVPAQIALTLKTLCGFSVREIASAFLAKEETIEKRLGRARKYFRDHTVELEAPTGRALRERRGAVLASLYLLFNEGYKQTESEGLFDRDLCLEAIRLTRIVAEHPEVRSPEAFALLALMTLVSARFETRTNDRGEIVLLSEQDRSKWNRELVEHGMEYFARSEPDANNSTYHLEAAIQSLHVTAATIETTDWPAILGLYKRLYAMKPSPIVAMHLSVAMGKVHGANAAVEQLLQSPLPDYYLYHALLGDAYATALCTAEARQSFTQAIALTKNAREKMLLKERLAKLSEEIELKEPIRADTNNAKANDHRGGTAEA
jgi:RNA polymerase sigma factor (sigma-70 family)